MYTEYVPIQDFSVTETSDPNFGSKIALNPSTAPTEMPPSPPITKAAKI